MMPRSFSTINLMNTNITFGTVLLVVFGFSFMMPDMFATSLTYQAGNLALVATVIYLLTWRYKPSRVAICSIAFYLFLVTVSALHSSPSFGLSFVVSRGRTVVFVCLVDLMLRRDKRSTLGLLLFMLSLAVFADFISLVLFPDGLTFGVDTTDGVGYEHYYSEWVLGNKNNRMYWYMALVTVAYWRHRLSPSFFSRFGLVALCVVSLMGAAISKSSTSIVALSIMSCGVLMGIWPELLPLPRVNGYVLAGVYLAFAVAMIVGNIGFLGDFVQQAFGKDLTFTGRADVWTKALALIARRPLSGWGYYDPHSASILYGRWDFANAHNQILESLVEGGLLFLLISSAPIFCILHSSRKCRSSRAGNFTTLAILALLVDMLLEQILGMKIVWVLLLLFDSMLIDDELRAEEAIETAPDLPLRRPVSPLRNGHMALGGSDADWK